MLDMLKGKKTYIIAIVGALLGLWQALGHDVPPALYAVLGALGLGTLRAGVAKAAAPVLALLLALAACSTPAASQGESRQGGSTGQAPVVNVTVTFAGDTKVDTTSAPTAAPASKSEAQATQTATTDVKPTAALGDSAIKTLGEAIIPKPTLPIVAPAPKEKPEPKPAPVVAVPDAALPVEPVVVDPVPPAPPR